MDLQLAGRRALITGGSRGIGLAIARALVAEGVAVALVARDADRLASAAEELRSAGGSVVTAVADVTDADQLHAAVDGAATALGGLDLLVANAGGSVGGRLLESTPGDWADTFALNVLHPANAVRAAVPHLRQSDAASVVLVSSISGRRWSPSSTYAAAKAAETHLAVVLAQELGEAGIRVNALSPGSTLFPGGSWERRRREQPEEFADFEYDEVPRHRLVTDTEVAAAAVFVLSPRASGITGAEVAVDAGQGRAGMARFWAPRAAGSGRPAADD